MASLGLVGLGCFHPLALRSHPDEDDARIRSCGGQVFVLGQPGQELQRVFWLLIRHVLVVVADGIAQVQSQHTGVQHENFVLRRQNPGTLGGDDDWLIWVVVLVAGVELADLPDQFVADRPFAFQIMPHFHQQSSAEGRGATGNGVSEGRIGHGQDEVDEAEENVHELPLWLDFHFNLIYK